MITAMRFCFQQSDGERWGNWDNERPGRWGINRTWTSVVKTEAHELTIGSIWEAKEGDESKGKSRLCAWLTDGWWSRYRRRFSPLLPFICSCWILFTFSSFSFIRLNHWASKRLTSSSLRFSSRFLSSAFNSSSLTSCNLQEKQTYKKECPPGPRHSSPPCPIRMTEAQWADSGLMWHSRDWGEQAWLPWQHAPKALYPQILTCTAFLGTVFVYAIKPCMCGSWTLRANQHGAESAGDLPMWTGLESSENNEGILRSQK